MRKSYTIEVYGPSLILTTEEDIQKAVLDAFPLYFADVKEQKESTEPEIPIEMDVFRETAAEVIDEVIDAFLEQYPDIEVKKEFKDECEEAAHLYGECYYNLESQIEDKLRDLFIKKPDPCECCKSSPDDCRTCGKKTITPVPFDPTTCAYPEDAHLCIRGCYAECNNHITAEA